MQLIKLITVPVVSVLLGLGCGYLLWFESEVEEITSKEQVDRLLSSPWNSDIVEMNFVHANQEKDIELTRYALRRLHEEGPDGIELAQAFGSIASSDEECRSLYLAMLEKELDMSVLGLVSIAKSLDREKDALRYRQRINLVIDYLGLDRAEYDKATSQGGKAGGQEWLIEQVDGLRNRLLDKNRHKLGSDLDGQAGN